MVSESRVTWATSVPILVSLGLSVLELGPMYATDRRQTKASLNASALWGRRHNNVNAYCANLSKWRKQFSKSVSDGQPPGLEVA